MKKTRLRWNCNLQNFQEITKFVLIIKMQVSHHEVSSSAATPMNSSSSHFYLYFYKTGIVYYIKFFYSFLTCRWKFHLLWSMIYRIELFHCDQWWINKCRYSQAIMLKPGSEIRDMWTAFPLPLDFKVYMFNVTNADEIMQGGKPKLNEVGPFFYE